MNPYNAMQTPPITQLGIEFTKTMKGFRKDITIAATAAVIMV